MSESERFAHMFAKSIGLVRKWSEIKVVSIGFGWLFIVIRNCFDIDMAHVIPRHFLAFVKNSETFGDHQLMVKIDGELSGYKLIHVYVRRLEDGKWLSGEELCSKREDPTDVFYKLYNALCGKLGVEPAQMQANESKDMKKVIRLTEGDLHRIVRESVNRILEGSIEIDPKNKGKFTKTQKETGKSTEELCHSKNKLTKKRANFARMAKRGWKPLKK